MTSHFDFFAVIPFDVLIIILTAVAIAFRPIWDYYRNRRELTYRVVSADAMIPGLPGLQMLFNGAQIPNPHMCTFELANTGRLPIVQGDYEGPLHIGFMPCSYHTDTPVNILTHVIRDTRPNSLTPQTQVQSDGKLDLQPLLLNPGDSMTITTLLDDCFELGYIDVRGRITGISKIGSFHRPAPSTIAIVASVVLLLAGVIMILLNLLTLGLAWIIIGGAWLAYISASLMRYLRRKPKWAGQ